MVASGSNGEVIVDHEREVGDDNVDPMADTSRLIPTLEKHREAELAIVEKIEGFVRQLDRKRSETELDSFQGAFIIVVNSSLYQSKSASLMRESIIGRECPPQIHCFLYNSCLEERLYKMLSWKIVDMRHLPCFIYR